MSGVWCYNTAIHSQALLVLSFGGPEAPDEVLPFLRNVTRGRNVSQQRLGEVAEHYLHFGGVSPINRCNRELVAALQDRLCTRGPNLPVYFGNRNWHPLVEDTVARMADDGVGRALVFATSAWGGYSGCRQYHEDIARARAAVGAGAPELVKLRQFFDHPLFVAAAADAARRALDRAGRGARLVFTAHSVPQAADAAAGLPAGGGHRYSRQVAEAARLVAAQLGVGDYDVAWQSRSGPPRVPWLGPDILDHLDALRADAVAVVPLGFVCDHMEVLWDLDIEASERAQRLGIRFARAETPGADRRFVEMISELVTEHTDGLAPRRLSAIPAAGCAVNGAPCAPGCCAPTR